MNLIKIMPLMLALAFITSCKAQQSTATSTSSSTPEKTRQTRQGGPPSVDQIFEMDSNNDGKLAKSELKGRILEQFDTIDADGDGFITRTEFENAPKPERGQGRPPRG